MLQLLNEWSTKSRENAVVSVLADALQCSNLGEVISCCFGDLGEDTLLKAPKTSVKSEVTANVSVSMAVDPKWKHYLRPNFATVTGSIIVTGTFLDLLVSYGLIDMNQRARIDLAGIESDKAAELLKVLIRCSPGSFDKFCGALDETSQEHLAKILRGK